MAVTLENLIDCKIKEMQKNIPPEQLQNSDDLNAALTAFKREIFSDIKNEVFEQLKQDKRNELEDFAAREKARLENEIQLERQNQKLRSAQTLLWEGILVAGVMGFFINLLTSLILDLINLLSFPVSAFLTTVFVIISGFLLFLFTQSRLLDAIAQFSRSQNKS